MEKESDKIYKVYSWGLGADGRLGTKEEKSEKTPKLTFSKALQVQPNAIINEKGEVFVFGSNKKGQLVSGGEEKIVEPEKLMSKVRFS